MTFIFVQGYYLFILLLLEPQLESVVDKQVKEIVRKEVKVSQEDIKKYTGAYGSWSENKNAGAKEQQKLGQKT